MPRSILHVDMDAFFAAIEQLDHPDLRGKPVIVGAPPDRRGVVSTCSYEARRYGVHSAMPSRTAYKLCPHGIFVPVRMARYAEVSDQVMGILDGFTPLLEQVSVDEAFLDMSGGLHAWPDIVACATELKRRIRERLGLTASVGVASNKFLAKVASDLHKPDALTVVPADEAGILGFLAPLPVTKIFGVGKVTARQLATVGIERIGQVQELSEEEACQVLGQACGRHVWALAHGRDERPIETETEEKSVSRETTFDEDVTSAELLHQTMLELAEQVGWRLRRKGKLAGTSRIKVRFEDFSTITRQQALPRPTSTDKHLLRAAMDLLGRETIRRPVRLLGFGVSNLTGAAEAAAPSQPDLFPELATPPADAKSAKLDQAVDALREKFGKDIVRRGGALGRKSLAE